MVLLAKNEKKCHFGIDVTAEINAVFGKGNESEGQSRLVKVQLADLKEDESSLAEIAAKVLTAAEFATFQGFRFLHRKQEWLAGRLAVKEAVSHLLAGPQMPSQEVEIGVDDKGKPFLATTIAEQKNVHLAISHSGGVALGLASFAPCALDFQEIRSSLSRVESKFAREGEAAPLQSWYPDRLVSLGLLWAAKEALRKYVTLWPLLGFLESDLQEVVGQGTGLLLSFQTKPAKRSLPGKLPVIWTALFEGNALAIIWGQDEN